jgi:hypothetical protein
MIVVYDNRFDALATRSYEGNLAMETLTRDKDASAFAPDES